MGRYPFMLLKSLWANATLITFIVVLLLVLLSLIAGLREVRIKGVNWPTLCSGLVRVVVACRCMTSNIYSSTPYNVTEGYIHINMITPLQ